MPSYLTKKQAEAVESCKKMKESFESLNTQIKIDYKDETDPLNPKGAIPLRDRLNDNQPNIDYGHQEFINIDTNSTSLNTKAKETLTEAINMNKIPAS